MRGPRTVFGQVLHDRRRGVVYWAIGIGAYVATTVAFWPAMPDMADLERLIEQMPEGLLALFGAGAQDLFSPAGFLDSQLFALVSPLLLLIAAIGGGAATIAGEERAGTLELLLANPVSRRRVVVEKAGGLAVVLAALTAVHLFVLVVMTLVVRLEIGLLDLAAMHASLLLLAWLFGGLALAVSAATGGRGVAIGVTAAIAVAAYLLDSFAPLIRWIEPFRPLSPFYLYRGHEPLANGLNPLHAGLLAVVAGACVALAVWRFSRRDIGT